MTRKEAERLTHQADQLRALGFTREEAEALRRISMTLHTWAEKECGDGNGCIERDDETGKPFWHNSLSGRRTRIADRKAGAIKRLKAILAARNKRGECHPIETCQCSYCVPVSYYIQGDPRGAALYIIRPGDVPDGADVNSYYSRGICVY